mgnify:CR=1 FL=1
MKIQANYNTKAPKWMLVLGIILLLSGNLLINIIPNIKNSLADNPIESKLLDFPRTIMFVFVVLIGPIIEEIAFRAWHLKRTTIRYISIIITMYYVYLVTSNVWISIALFPILLWLILFKPNRNKRIIAVIATSLIFALVHVGNYSANWSMLLSMVTIFGMSLLLNYITWRYSIIWAFLLHIANNGLAMLALSQDSEIINIRTATYEMTIQQKKYIDNHVYSFKDDSITVIDDLNRIVSYWIEPYYQDSTYFYINQKNVTKLAIEITMSPTANKQNILDTIISTLGYQFDTIEIQKYYLILPDDIDTPEVTLQKGKQHLNIRLEEIGDILRKEFNIPMYFDKKYNDKVIKIDAFIINKMTTEQIFAAFEKSNILFLKDSTNTIKSVQLIPKE